MKNQYFGDINDYRKYGLLRILCKRFAIGVGWMLTPNDEGTEGKFVDYLDKPNKWRNYAPSLFDALQLYVLNNRRYVGIAEEETLIREAKYFTRFVTDDLEERQTYMADMLDHFVHCDLVFFDPDNGIEVPSIPKGKKNSSKYVYWDELKTFFDAGKSLLIYQHFQRVEREAFIASITATIIEKFGARVVTAFRTGNVVFFFIPQDGVTIAPLRDQLAQQWSMQFEMSLHNQ
ncbi:MAG: hypothetical protein SH821_09160 [Phototrophicales bacterium]|nr:hypothetical protein [Phototrophicales bacterium]